MSGNRFTCFLPPEDYEKLRAQYPKFNEPWDENDIEELKKMAADELPLEVMAGQLGRTPNSLRMRLRAMGLWTAPPASKAWSKEDEAALVDGYEAGVSFEDLAEQFGRSVRAVVARLVLLRVRLFTGE